MEWLSPVDMEEFYSRVSKHRTRASGSWLLQNDTFQAWLRCQHRAIWISGLPGSGKTFLSTVIVENLRAHVDRNLKHKLAFIFGDKSDENSQSCHQILANIIAQVLAELQEIPGHMHAAYSTAIRHGRPRLSASDQPVHMLKDLALSLDDLYIVIDGLDELKDHATVVESLDYLVESTTNIQIVLLSRELPALRSRIKGLQRIELTPDIVSVDIEEFLHQQLHTLPTEDPELLNQVFEKLSHAADGSFLWSSLMMRSLRSATSPHEILQILSDIPIGLDEIYSAIVDELAKEAPRRRALARKILLAICLSARPLSWRQLQIILAFEKSRSCFTEARKPFKSAVLELSGSLFEYNTTLDQFRLTHLSVREFLLSPPSKYRLDEGAKSFFIQENEGHSELAEICIVYQSQYLSNVSMGMQVGKDPFLEYATLFWCPHVCQAAFCPALGTKVLEMLASRLGRQAWILRFLNWQSPSFPLQHLMKLQKALSAWFAKSEGTSSNKDLLDWIQDIPDTLLCNVESLSVDSSSNDHVVLRLFNNLQTSISHFEKLMVIRDLSREYTMRGTLANGERWLNNALEAQRRRRGHSDISTAWLMNGLGIIYDQQQRTLLSSQTQESALAIQESVLGPNHLETIWTVNELGRVYRHLGDLKNAEMMHQRALKVLRSVLHPQDLQIAWTLNTLARTYRKQCRFDEAIALHDQALAIQRTTLGDTHPHTLWATMDKAACYLGQRRHQASADLYREALEGRKRVLGPKHADTLWAVNNLGRVLEKLGRVEEAKRLQERALQGQSEVLGQSHPHTVWTRERLEMLNNIQSVDDNIT